jgi:hypothetical protein
MPAKEFEAKVAKQTKMRWPPSRGDKEAKRAAVFHAENRD